MKKIYFFIMGIIMFFIGINYVDAVIINDCEVLVSYKLGSSLDDEKFICKNKEYGKATDSIYYSGDGKIILSNFNAYYFSVDDNVDISVNGKNLLSLLHIGDYVMNIDGDGELKFKESSYLKKNVNGELVYNYVYKEKTLLNVDDVPYEGTMSQFLLDYEILKEKNQLEEEFLLEDCTLLQVDDYVNMTSISITDLWINQHIETMKKYTVEDGYGVIKLDEKEEKKEEVVTKNDNVLESENVILVSNKKMNSKYKLSVDDLSDKKDKVNKNLKKKDKYDVLSLYDVNVYKGKKKIPMKNGVYTIKIKFEEDQKYQDYKIIYVSDDGEVEYLDGRIDDGYIIFKTTHLSQYGVVATSVVPEVVFAEVIGFSEVKDYSKLIGIIILSVIALISFVIIIILYVKSGLLNKKKKRRKRA